MINLFLLAAVLLAQAPLAHPGIDLKGKLYRAVFVPGPDVLSPGDLSQVPEPMRARLSRFLVRRVNFTSAYEHTPADVRDIARDAKRRALERAIVALSDGDKIDPRALAFVKDAPIEDDWKGQAAGPLAESAFAEQLLLKEPSTPLAPFLCLFIAQRQRAAAEAAEASKSEPVAKAAAARAREFLQKARAAPDPIYGLVADDLERLPYVYIRKKPGPA